MKKHTYILLVAALLLMAGEALAQKTVLSGRVTELLGGRQEPIFSANVVVVNTQNRYLNGVVTDVNGYYNLTVPVSGEPLTIKVSFIGMKTKTFPFTGQKTLNVVLESDALALSDVVVTERRLERDEMGISQIGRAHV